MWHKREEVVNNFQKPGHTHTAYRGIQELGMYLHKSGKPN